MALLQYYLKVKLKVKGDTMDSYKKLITLIIPAYNEKEVLESLKN